MYVYLVDFFMIPVELQLPISSGSGYHHQNHLLPYIPDQFRRRNERGTLRSRHTTQSRFVEVESGDPSSAM